MISKPTKLFFLMIVLWAGIWNLARAQVVINEVKVKDGEFIEIYNSGSQAIDMTDYFLAYYSTTKTSWLDPWRKKQFPKNSSVGINNYFLIAVGGYTGSYDWQFYSSDQLGDSSGTISLWSGDPTLGTSTRLDAFGWGNAFLVEGDVFSQIIEGDKSTGRNQGQDTDNSATDFSIVTPTPGAANSAGSGGSGNDGGESSSGENSDSTTIPMVQPPPTPRITVDIISKISVVAGVPLYFSAKATGLSGEPLTRGKFLWSFGDGGSLESSDNYKFTHTYFYPGEYVVILEYSQSVYASAPDATDRLTIKVLPAGVSITSFGSAPDFPVELSNSATSEIDISGWVLQSVTKLFRLPQNTLMLPSKKLILSGRLTGFTVDDAKTLRLVLPRGDLVFDRSE